MNGTKWVKNRHKYPGDIAETIWKYIGETDDTRSPLHDALYDLYCICENEYNQDYWQVFYEALEAMTNKIAQEEQEGK